MKNMTLKSLIVVGILLPVYVACSDGQVPDALKGSAKDESSGDATGNDNKKDKNDDGQVVAGTNLLSFDNARILCDDPMHEGGGIYLISCSAAIAKSGNVIVQAGGVAKGIGLGWWGVAPGGSLSDDTPDCANSLASAYDTLTGLSFECRFSGAVGSTYSPQLLISEGVKQRIELVKLVMP